MVNSSILPLRLNGVDFSSSFKYKRQSESMRKISGPNGGRVTLDGTEWTDQIAVKYDLTATILPMRPARLAQLGQILTQPYFTIEYFSGWRNAIVSQTVICPQAQAVLALIKLAGTQPIYADMSITFRQR